MSKKIKKEYKLPQEVHEKFLEVQSLRNLRDTFVKLSPLGAFNLAARASLKADRANREAWNMVVKLYPETSSKRMSYNNHTMKLTEEENTEE